MKLTIVSNKVPVLMVLQQQCEQVGAVLDKVICLQGMVDTWIPGKSMAAIAPAIQG